MVWLLSIKKEVMDAIIEFANPALRRYALKVRDRYVIFQLPVGSLEPGEKVSGLLETLGRATWYHERRGKMKVFVEDFQRTQASAVRWVGIQAHRSASTGLENPHSLANPSVASSRALSDGRSGPSNREEGNP